MDSRTSHETSISTILVSVYMYSTIGSISVPKMESKSKERWLQQPSSSLGIAAAAPAGDGGARVIDFSRVVTVFVERWSLSSFLSYSQSSPLFHSLLCWLRVSVYISIACHQ